MLKNVCGFGFYEICKSGLEPHYLDGDDMGAERYAEGVCGMPNVCDEVNWGDGECDGCMSKNDNDIPF